MQNQNFWIATLHIYKEKKTSRAYHIPTTKNSKKQNQKKKKNDSSLTLNGKNNDLDQIQARQTTNEWKSNEMKWETTKKNIIIIITW